MCVPCSTHETSSLEADTTGSRVNLRATVSDCGQCQRSRLSRVPVATGCSYCILLGYVKLDVTGWIMRIGIIKGCQFGKKFL